MKNKAMLLFILGQASLAISLVLNQYFSKTMYMLVFIGFFTALSIVFNIAFLVKKIRELKAKARE